MTGKRRVAAAIRCEIFQADPIEAVAAAAVVPDVAAIGVLDVDHEVVRLVDEAVGNLDAPGQRLGFAPGPARGRARAEVTRPPPIERVTAVRPIAVVRKSADAPVDAHSRAPRQALVLVADAHVVMIPLAVAAQE